MGTAPLVQRSDRGGHSGRGLFTASGGCPIALEFLRDPSYGNHGFISSEESDRIFAESSPACEYAVFPTLDVWFRDEFSGGNLQGTLRPLAAALPGWLEERRCAQDIQWDAKRGYRFVSNEVAFVTLNSSS